MPCTSIVVLQQSTHTYVIKLRGSRTIQAIVTPNSDQHKGPHQSRSKLTLDLHNCFPGLEITVSSLRAQTNVIGPCWELPGICQGLIGLEPSVERVGIFVNDESRWMVMRAQLRKDKRWRDILEWLQRRRQVSTCALHCLCVCVCVRASKGKRRWLCQGWVITVVFSALRGGSDGCDGWLAVWAPSSRLSPAQRLEIWAEVESWRGRAAGWLGVNTAGRH